MDVINYRDSRPIFEQISDHYKHLILAGVMEPGEKLPSVRTLAVELATNPNTIQKAFAELERSGYCYSVQGRGSFVSEDTKELVGGKKAELKERMEKIRDEADQIGLDADALWQETSERKKK